MGLLCISLIRDLLWSDPVNNDKGILFPAFIKNERRGFGTVFGVKALMGFLKGSSICTVIRGHEVYNEGYNLHYWD